LADTSDRLYAELIAPIEGRIKGTVAGMLSDPEDAADALQNALFYIWKNLARIHRHPNPHGYILRVCISSAHDVARRRASRRRRETQLAFDPAASPADAGSAGAIRPTMAAIRKGIATLPKKQAQAVMLRLLDEKSFDLIGKALGCSEATARSHVSKGLARLREQLSSSGLHPAEG